MPEMERADQSYLVLKKGGGLAIETVKLAGKVLKPKNSRTMYENLHGIQARRASTPVQCKITIHSLLNFLFLKILPVPQFSV